MRHHYDNLVEALAGLKEEGYTLDFNIVADQVYCHTLKKGYTPSQFQIEEVLVFEGEDSSADTRSYLYLIQTEAGEKGTMIAEAGIYIDLEDEVLIRKLKHQQK